MLSLQQLLEILDTLAAQGIFNAAQTNKLKTAATAMLTTFGGEQEYQAKYQLFLHLLGDKAAI